jgi:hypothetical protein
MTRRKTRGDKSMKKGARIVKTGIAVTITMFICQKLNLEPALFGAVSAIINMQPSIFLTLKMARDQILVHILGVTTAFAFGYLVGSNPLAMGLTTVFIIYLYGKLNLQNGITMGIVAAVFVLGSGPEQFLPHAVTRTAVIFTGLSTAMLVNVLLWPPRYKERFAEQLRTSNQEAVRYFCRAVQDYVQLENEVPEEHQEQRDKVYKLNGELRVLGGLLRREGQTIIPGSAVQDEWFAMAEKFMNYNDSLAEKADRIYDLLPPRLERRLKSGAPPISDEFKAILEMLAEGCVTVTRVNEKLRSVIMEGDLVEPEEISEDYWEILTQAIEQWQPRLTGSYFLHALIEVAVTANEIKWAARHAKKLLNEAQQEKNRH